MEQDLFARVCYFCFEKAPTKCSVCGFGVCGGCRSLHKKWKHIFHPQKSYHEAKLHKKNLTVFENTRGWITPVPGMTHFISSFQLEHGSPPSDASFAERPSDEPNSQSAGDATGSTAKPALRRMRRTRSRSTNTKARPPHNSGNRKQFRNSHPRKKQSDSAKRSSTFKDKI